MKIRAEPDRNLRRTRADAGVSLVEVMVAVLILSITLGGGVQAMMSYRRLAEAAQRQIVAIHAARATLEELTALSFYHANLSVGIHAIPSGGSYTVSRIPPTDTFSKQKLLVVTTPWTDGDPSRTNSLPGEFLTTVISEALHP